MMDLIFEICWEFGRVINVNVSGLLNRLNTVYSSSLPLKFKYISLQGPSKPCLTTAIINSFRTK